MFDDAGGVADWRGQLRCLRGLISSTPVDALNDNSTPGEVDAASAIADRAWDTWYAANEYAAELGVSDRTPTERAALQRLAKLVTRLTRTTADDPEVPAITRDTAACLKKITTVSVGWADITALPAIDRAHLHPQLDHAHSTR